MGLKLFDDFFCSELYLAYIQYYKYKVLISADEYYTKANLRQCTSYISECKILEITLQFNNICSLHAQHH